MPVVLVALALQALASATAPVGGEPPLGMFALAQAAGPQEDFGDPPPPPPPPSGEGSDAADPFGEAPPLPPPTLDEDAALPPASSPAPAAPAPPPDANGGDEPLDPLLTRALQYGAGLGTVAACAGLGCTGVACASPILLVALQPFALSLPLLYPCVTAAAVGGTGAVGAAAAGAVSGLVGDAFGEDGGLLWPTVAAAGAGAGLIGVFTGAAFASHLAAGASPYRGTPLSIRFETPVACLFGSAAVALAGLYCVGAPLAGVLAYGLAASGGAEEEAAEVARAPSVPAGPRVASAMAF